MFDFFRTKPKKYTDLKAEEFKTGMTAKDAVIIDVRTAGEFQSEKIKGARNIDLMGKGFQAQLMNLPKEKKYYIYCRSGNRSGQACDVMADMGFEQTFNLQGGVMRWPFELV
ncbi:rhodanese-like domain-containing protein [Mongoliibacter ruber]|nr:rhodanese-like domain-containing protein [Mongoliibacter ruber]